MLNYWSGSSCSPHSVHLRSTVSWKNFSFTMRNAVPDSSHSSATTLLVGHTTPVCDIPTIALGTVFCAYLLGLSSFGLSDSSIAWSFRGKGKFSDLHGSIPASALLVSTFFLLVSNLSGQQGRLIRGMDIRRESAPPFTIAANIVS
jgi:hypothetical protein